MISKRVRATLLLSAAVFLAVGFMGAIAFAAGPMVWGRITDGRAHRADYGVDVATNGKKGIYVAARIDNAGFDGDFATIKYSRRGRKLWQRLYSGAGAGSPEIPTAIGVDRRGNAYIAGNVEVNGHNDFQVIKYSSTGALLWVRRFNAMRKSDDLLTSMAVSQKGDVYIGGVSDTFQGNKFDYLTIKYGTGGRLKWATRFDGPAHGEDYLNDLAIDKAGNAYVTGYSVKPGGSSQYTTIKYDRRGRLKWKRRAGGVGQNIAKAVAVNRAGDVFVTGSAYVEGGADYLTIKYRADGRRDWVRRYSGANAGSDSGGGLTPGPDGSVYVVGESLDYGTWRSDVAVVKYDSSGLQSWVALYGGQTDFDYEFTRVGADGRGNLYVTGMYESFELPADIFIVKYNTAGAMLWEHTYGANKSDVADRVNGLAVREDGFAFMTGSTYSRGSENIITRSYAP